MNKSKLSLYFIFITLFTLVTVFVTIVQVSYSNLVNPQKQVEEDKYLEPLNPILDSDVIQEIERRQNLVDDNSNVFIYDSSLEENNISPTPTEIIDEINTDDELQNILLNQE